MPTAVAGPAATRDPEALWLGVDEAGRGSLVGPLVVGGFAARAGEVGRLTGLGVRDSKLLSPARREAAYRRLSEVGARYSVVLAPAQVDAAVRHGGLNDLEAQAFARLIRLVRPAATFVDACDPVAARFGALVARLAAATGPVDARHHADRDLPVVAAASIVAKVRRDRHLARLRRTLGAGLGSGYPSDEKTRAFVRATLGSGGPAPPWLRASWRTTETLKAAVTTRTLEAFER